MKTRTWVLWLALLPPLAGCGGGDKAEMKEEAGPSEEAGEHEEHAGEEHAEGEALAGEEGMLVVDAEVLRDLKLTTFPAELRPGGEGVTALGELKVNEEAYAEAGTPIPARVVRLIASPGQSVRRGQPLDHLRAGFDPLAPFGGAERVDRDGGMGGVEEGKRDHGAHSLHQIGPARISALLSMLGQR